MAAAVATTVAVGVAASVATTVAVGVAAAVAVNATHRRFIVVCRLGATDCNLLTFSTNQTVRRKGA